MHGTRLYAFLQADIHVEPLPTGAISRLKVK